MEVNGQAIDYSPLPLYMREGMQLYIEHKIKPGSFLTAVLCNDLRGAAVNADDVNRYMLFQYVQWLYSNAPAGCWGSRERFNSWLSSK